MLTIMNERATISIPTITYIAIFALYLSIIDTVDCFILLISSTIRLFSSDLSLNSILLFRSSISSKCPFFISDKTSICSRILL